MADLQQRKLERREQTHHHVGAELRPTASREQQSQLRVGPAKGPKQSELLSGPTKGPEQSELLSRSAESPELQPAAPFGQQQLQQAERRVLRRYGSGSPESGAGRVTEPQLLAE